MNLKQIKCSAQITVEWVMLILVSAVVAFSAIKGYMRLHLQGALHRNIKQISSDLYDENQGTWYQHLQITDSSLSTDAGLKIRDLNDVEDLFD
ncbi:MAG: hypothetical protein NC914_00075 [Candidatus Omnitrophica bacterium]|nr:hypothetical protein [Candidatus Omnitrophota bacterium]